MPDALDALRSSVNRLSRLVKPLDTDSVALPAYPSEWTIADVVSHLGSGAVIFQRRLDDTLAASPTPDDLNAAVWDEWNAKSPQAKVEAGVIATAALVDRLDEIPPADRTSFRLAMGPLEFDWDGFVRMRLNEHLVHEWDVAVALDPAATLSDDGTEIVIDNLDLTARFTAKPSGPAGKITIATTGPNRDFAVTVDASSVLLASTSASADADLSMPAESLVRLVYGRLDPEHTPSSVTGNRVALDQLRNVFPGP